MPKELIEKPEDPPELLEEESEAGEGGGGSDGHPQDEVDIIQSCIWHPILSCGIPF